MEAIFMSCIHLCRNYFFYSLISIYIYINIFFLCLVLSGDFMYSERGVSRNCVIDSSPTVGSDPTPLVDGYSENEVVDKGGDAWY